MSLPRSIPDLSESLASQKYLADQGLATALFFWRCRWEDRFC